MQFATWIVVWIELLKNFNSIFTIRTIFKLKVSKKKLHATFKIHILYLFSSQKEYLHWGLITIISSQDHGMRSKFQCLDSTLCFWFLRVEYIALPCFLGMKEYSVLFSQRNRLKKTFLSSGNSSKKKVMKFNHFGSSLDEPQGISFSEICTSKVLPL